MNNDTITSHATAAMGLTVWGLSGQQWLLVLSVVLVLIRIANDAYSLYIKWKGERRARKQAANNAQARVRNVRSRTGQ